MISFFNGGFVRENEYTVRLNDRGLTLADGVFDTMLAINGRSVMASEHAERLARHAAILGISFSLDLETTAHSLLRENGFTQGRYAIRTTITRGPAARGLAPPEDALPTIIMTAGPAPERYEPVNMIIAETVRRNESSPLSRIKSLNYGDNILALMEAQKKGAEDAVMLNGKGYVCCGTASNIFIMEGRRTITPPLDDGVLDGTFRQSLMQKHKPDEEHIDAKRLLKADAVFLTNSLTGIRPVRRIDDTAYAYTTVANLAA